MTNDQLVTMWAGFVMAVVALVIGFLLGALTRLEGTVLNEEEEDHVE